MTEPAPSLKCRLCKKTVTAQLPHPNIRDGSQLVSCTSCDIHSVLGANGEYTVPIEPKGEELRYC